MLKWGFHAVKENNIWQVGVEGLTFTSPLSQGHFFQISTFQVHSNCAFEGHKRNSPEAYTRWSQTVLPHRSEWPHAENVWNTSALSKGKTDELRSFPLIPMHLLTACTGQQGKEQRGSSWSNASTWGFWQQELGVFLHPSSVELSAGKTLCFSELLKPHVLCLHLWQSSPDPALLLAWAEADSIPLAAPVGHPVLVRPEELSSHI